MVKPLGSKDLPTAHVVVKEFIALPSTDSHDWICVKGTSDTLEKVLDHSEAGSTLNTLGLAYLDSVSKKRSLDNLRQLDLKLQVFTKCL